MTSYIIPVIFLTVLLISIFRKDNSYSTFIGGTKNALTLMAEVFPFLLAVMVAVEVYRASGLNEVVSQILAPVTSFLGLPSELTELILIRPVSGAGALAILDNIFTLYGTDTYIGLCASLIYGSSETIFYISSIYFSKSEIKNLRYAIPVALFSTLLGCVVGCALLRVFSI